jgi:hypothetical protein
MSSVTPQYILYRRSVASKVALDALHVQASLITDREPDGWH